MQIKPLRSVVVGAARLKRNVIAEIADSTGQKLIDKGLAVPVGGEAGKENPTKASRSRGGGKTGKGKTSSSSPADQAPKTSPSKPQKDDAAS